MVGQEEDAATRKTRVVEDCTEAHFDESFTLPVHFADMALLMVWLKDYDAHKVKVSQCYLICNDGGGSGS